MIRDALRLKKEIKLKRDNESKKIASASAVHLSNSGGLNENKENKESSNLMLSSKSDFEMGSEHQIIKIHPWLIVFSDALEKPFYYNQITKMGQFKVCNQSYYVIFLFIFIF